MISKDFTISTRFATTRLSSVLQHKLRVVLKCYTIINFELNKEENSFSFNKTHRIRGIKVLDKKDYVGSYILEENENPEEDEEYNILITVN